jgi:hypothetical protein
MAAALLALLRVCKNGVLKMRIRLTYAGCSLLALLAGIVVYAFFRDTAPAVLERLRGQIPGHVPANVPKGSIGAIFLGSAPSGLWLLSGILLIRSVWIGEAKWCGRYVLCLCALAILFEALQVSEYIPGTFDLFDMTALSLAAVFEGIVYTFFI